jgi:hypothetical protein
LSIKLNSPFHKTLANGHATKNQPRDFKCLVTEPTMPSDHISALARFLDFIVKSIHEFQKIKAQAAAAPRTTATGQAQLRQIVSIATWIAVQHGKISRPEAIRRLC